METEQVEIFQFLRKIAPFNKLSEETIRQAACQVEIGYFKSGQDILTLGESITDLHCVRSGAVEIYRRNGELYNRFSSGGLFGYHGLLLNQKVRFPATAIEDTLIYFLPAAVFTRLLEQEDDFADFFEVEESSRLRQVVSRRQSNNDQMTSKVSTLITRSPVTLFNSASIQDAARLMTEESVSSLLIIEPEGEEAEEQAELDPVPDSDLNAVEHNIRGIITDRDLRTRVVATGLPLETQVHEIMSQALVTISSDDYVFEAMLMMLRSKVHHLPVLKKGVPVGVINLSDIVRYESQNSLFVVSSIFRQQSVEELSVLKDEVQASFIRLVNEDANSHMIGSAMAVIGRSFKQRLLELAEEQLGPPPVPYCFLAMGSMARDEQFLVTDQDNALILDDSYDPEQHGEYFRQLARFVCDGLAACGYRYCTGQIMATNDQWRQPRQVWEQYFTDWIDQPTPKTLLDSSIFFDLDGIWGRTEWVEQLKGLINRRARRSQRFLASMARNALNRTPPLGFFKTFVMEQDGQHKNSINLKRRGTAPLTDLIRVHALAIGSRAQNSFERLDDIIDAEILPQGRGEDLRGALEFISMVRIRHQARDVEKGIEPDNNIEPENMSHFERRNLKDAFQIVSDAQKFLTFRYHPNRVN